MAQAKNHIIISELDECTVVGDQASSCTVDTIIYLALEEGGLECLLVPVLWWQASHCRVDGPQQFAHGIQIHESFTCKM